MGNNTLTLTPLFRRSVGFDRFNDLFESAFRGDDGGLSYPPYNIERMNENAYRITMAVAGFSEEDITVTLHGNELKVSGHMSQETKEEEAEYLHRGIASRAFERSFSLADHMQVGAAELKDGLLRIQLKREIPESAQPRVIAVNQKGDSAVKQKKAS